MTDIDAGSQWWRSAVIYQIYPRSFADGNGDGIGDLAGIAARLPQLASLSLDAIWLSPFYTSPQNDAGYDVADYCAVDPLFGTLEDFDSVLDEAHKLDLKLIIDLVPNHTSNEHIWFKDAVAAGPGSIERSHYLFRDGKGPGGIEPPNNWQSVFGGPAWTRLTAPDGTPEQWYLHLFDTSQPDLDWTSEWVRQQFRDILRFWLKRGVDGFRVDVAHGLAKKVGLPDFTPPVPPATVPTSDYPFWAQPAVHEIYRDWHDILLEFGPDRVLCAEAWVEPLSTLAHWVRPNEMQQAFNFTFLEAGWSATAIRAAITDSYAAFERVGAAPTWVLSNHDVIRHATRLAMDPPPPQGDGFGPRSEPKPDAALGLRRARAATLMMLALPGGAYLYQGEELGLPEDIDLPDSAREDPTFFRHNGKVYGRDGCRVPIPWEAEREAFGFSTAGKSWLPQPPQWAELARDQQLGQDNTTLDLYEDALSIRHRTELGKGTLAWLEGYGDDVVAFTVTLPNAKSDERPFTVVMNAGSVAVPLPGGDLSPRLHSGEVATQISEVAPNSTVWMISS